MKSSIFQAIRPHSLESFGGPILVDANQNQNKTSKPQNKSVFRLAKPGQLESLEPLQLQCPPTTRANQGL